MDPKLEVKSHTAAREASSHGKFQYSQQRSERQFHLREGGREEDEEEEDMKILRKFVVQTQAGKLFYNAHLRTVPPCGWASARSRGEGGRERSKK